MGEFTGLFTLLRGLQSSELGFLREARREEDSVRKPPPRKRFVNCILGKVRELAKVRLLPVPVC